MSVRFSIVVPIAPSRTGRVLESLRQLNGTGSYEVLTETGSNPSCGRNRAIARARGGILAFTDEDCSVPPDWLDRAWEIFQAHPEADVVGGPQLTPQCSSFFERMSGRALASRFVAFRMSRRYRRGLGPCVGGEWSLSSANLFIRRSALPGPEPFDPRLHPNEETNLLARLGRDGRRMRHEPDLVVYHHRRPTVLGLARQCRGYGRGRARQNRLDGRRWPGWNVVIPLAFLAYLVALPLLLQIHPVAWLPLAAYAACCSWLAASAARHEGDLRALAALPLVILMIHVSYPLGYLAEVLWRPHGVALRPAESVGAPAG